MLKEQWVGRWLNDDDDDDDDHDDDDDDDDNVANDVANMILSLDMNVCFGTAIRDYDHSNRISMSTSGMQHESAAWTNPIEL